jgi:hypothetical protein
MEISNEELFEHAMSDEQPEVMAETQVTEGQDGQPRDDQGRFAEKSEEVVKPEQQAKPEVKEEGPPAWRLRELREERDELRRQLAAAQRPAPQTEKPAKPDLFEKPDEFVRQGAQEIADPINARVNSVVEFYSKRDAIKEHGQERLNEAYSALDRAANSGDPVAIAKALEKFKGEREHDLRREAQACHQHAPNMRRVAAAATLDDGGDLSNESLFAHATS